MHALVRTKAVCGGRPGPAPGLALALLAALSGFLAGCGEAREPEGSTAASTTGNSTTTGTPVGTTGAPTGCLSTTAEDGSLSLLVDPANNYAFDSTVTLTVVQVAPNTPLSFDWSGLSIDIMKQPIDPAGGEVAAVLVSLLDLTVQAFQDKLNANENLVNYAKGALAFYPTTETAATIDQFVSPGAVTPPLPEEIDPFFDPVVSPPERFTFAALVQDVTESAHGVRMVQAFQLDPNSLNTEVALTNSSADLVYDTDLTAVVPVQVPAGVASIAVDWKHLNDVANNALGQAWIKGEVDEVMVGQYLLTPQQLTEQFLGLENIANQLYRAPVAAGSSVDLSTLVEETTGAAFAGIDGAGTWILALNCSDCTNPAPWFLTILQACS